MLKRELLAIIDFLPSAPTPEGCKRPLSLAKKATVRRIAWTLNRNIDVFAPGQNENFKSRQTLAAELDCNKREFSRRVTQLEKLGYIRVEECYDRNGQTTNAYFISPIVELAVALRTAVRNGEKTDLIEKNIAEQLAVQSHSGRRSRQNGRLGALGKKRAKAQRLISKINVRLQQTLRSGRDVTNILNRLTKIETLVTELTVTIGAKSFLPVQKLAPGGCETQHRRGVKLNTQNSDINPDLSHEFSLRACEEQTAKRENTEISFAELSDHEQNQPTESRTIELAEFFETTFSKFSALPDTRPLTPAAKEQFITKFLSKEAQGFTSCAQINSNLELWAKDYYIQQQTNGLNHSIGRLFQDLEGTSYGKRRTYIESIMSKPHKIFALVGHCNYYGLDPYKFSHWLFEGKGPSNEEIMSVINKLNRKEDHEVVQEDSPKTEIGTNFDNVSAPDYVQDYSPNREAPKAERSATKPSRVEKPVKLDLRTKDLVSKIQAYCLKKSISTGDIGWLTRCKSDFEPQIASYEDAQKIYSALTCAVAA